MSLDFEHGVLFRSRSGASEFFDTPLSRRSAREVARLLARRWKADVQVIPCARDGTPLHVAAFEQAGPARGREHRRSLQHEA